MLSKIKSWVIALGQTVRQILSQPINALLALLVMLLVALASFFLWALAVEKGGEVARLLEIDDKAEVLRLIGWGMGGLLAAIGVIALNRRAAAMEKGLIDERFKAAVQSLAGEQPSVRIAAFYQFYYLAKDNPDTDFRSSIFDILCAHLRQITSNADYRENIGREKPNEECQSLLDILFKKPNNVFLGMAANLKGVYLVGADLINAELQRADFKGAKALNAYFCGANLQNVEFAGSNLRHADFESANLSNADFYLASMHEACLNGAVLQGAKFEKATASSCVFFRADMQSAMFTRADLHSANFWGANASKTNFDYARMQHAVFENGANLQGARFDSANIEKSYFIDVDLRGADFSYAKNAETAKFYNIKMDANTKFPEDFREGEHYTLAKEE